MLARVVGVRLGEQGQRVVVRSVVAGSPAEEAGLARGDVLLQVNGQRITTIADLDKILAREHTRSSLLLVVQRGPFAYQLPFPLSS